MGTAESEVEWCYATGGGVDYIMLVNARSVDDYQHLMDRLLASDIGIERYYSYIVTKAVTDPLKP